MQINRKVFCGTFVVFYCSEIDILKNEFSFDRIHRYIHTPYIIHLCHVTLKTALFTHIL